MKVGEFLDRINGKKVNQIVKAVCGEKIGFGVHRDVYELKGFPDYVVKIERNPAHGMFANATEFRYYHDNREWKFLGPWLAPCILINETGQIMVQQRVEHRRRKDYPKYVPAMFTDLKLKNFGWIGDRFVACDYSYMVFTEPKMKYAKWWGTLKNKQN